jgi:hypothetical protein
MPHSDKVRPRLEAKDEYPLQLIRKSLILGARLIIRVAPRLGSSNRRELLGHPLAGFDQGVSIWVQLVRRPAYMPFGHRGINTLIAAANESRADSLRRF